MSATTTAFTFLGILLTWRDVAIIAIDAIGFIVVAILFLWFVFRRQWRLFKNISKPLIFINLTDVADGMSVEAAMLKKSGFFSTPEVSSDPRSIDLIDRQSLIILGVGDTTNLERFKEIYTKIKGLTKPVIIYTLGNRDTSFLRDNNTLVKSYSFHTIATTPLRLVSDIFTILSTFPH